ncbi:MAG: DUF374 domain-containing protein [Candidatus Abyssobacteria bacterium SURF_5]|uniref:DUF374 domain-containing protein n=1 Tax=Abyssobacteria bacterium (strain SURF_5) TaxID=2093360 RepID=A0A3A4NAJ0_ABYX5|nr:MAG: DUF374 domain-containing protein [Candidatus Abyssubacteria bacterium SURF_5]
MSDAQRKKKKYSWLRRLGQRAAVVIIPLLYNSYMWLVYHTSEILLDEMSSLWEATARGENMVAAVWHQDAIISPFCQRGHAVLVMVSRSRLGDVLTEIFRRCHFIAIRGGSSKGGREALGETIEYMKTHRGVLCGMAVDGSRGPARKAKMGTIKLAQAAGIPIYPLRAWAKRKVHAPTWDQTLIPFPFNKLAFFLGEPLVVPPDSGYEELEEFRRELERRLNELVSKSENFFR